MLDNEECIVPIAMNIGIKASKGDVVMRLDADNVGRLTKQMWFGTSSLKYVFDLLNYRKLQDERASSH